ncbi:hypothetical protein P9274_23960 [Schinkia azotoformans]|uniref:hypothetical protein n=1 Tax=Schinkia azotoformans TaxID=1454 RepID=UPI002E1C36AF|nr:hypothetical protein [Schinkia azotoformans]
MKTEVSKRNFVKELSLINKNKFTLEQTKSLYLGLLYEIISSKEVFKRNRDIEDFIYTVFKKRYNDYLYKARPYLASRVLKDVSEDYEFLKMSASVKLIILYLQDKDSSNNINNFEGKRSSNNIEDETIGWFHSVRKGSNQD